MEDIINELTEKVDLAIGEIDRLKNEITEITGQKEEADAKNNELEAQLRKMETESGEGQGKFHMKLSGVSGRINDIIKKLDSVV
jgi:predicted  nucleic acid-binding Zn-ribbon protein